MRCPSDIVEYQTHVDGVDRGWGQHKVMGANVSNMAHFTKWHKKLLMGITDFSFLQAYAAWNLSFEELKENGRGEEIKRK